MSIKKRAKRKTLKCKACDREAGERDFCLLHLKAYENIVEKYDFWRKVLKISWKEYLSEIKQNSLTGEWAKEVANYLVNSEGTRSVKES
jgi:predicted metal-binding protein